MFLVCFHDLSGADICCGVDGRVTARLNHKATITCDKLQDLPNEK